MENISTILLAAGIFAFIAFFLFVISRLLLKKTGIPEGRIIYSDPGVWNKPQKPLYDSAIGLTGRPDYLIKNGNQIIPAEVKSSWAPSSPYDSHILQLAAYCVLVESAFQQRPPYGILRYRNRTFKIQFSVELEQRVMGLIENIRAQKNRDEIQRSHNHKSRCSGCGYRNICDQRL